MAKKTVEVSEAGLTDRDAMVAKRDARVVNQQEIKVTNGVIAVRSRRRIVEEARQGMTDMNEVTMVPDVKAMETAPTMHVRITKPTRGTSKRTIPMPHTPYRVGTSIKNVVPVALSTTQVRRAHQRRQMYAYATNATILAIWYTNAVLTKTTSFHMLVCAPRSVATNDSVIPREILMLITLPKLPMLTMWLFCMTASLLRIL